MDDSELPLVRLAHCGCRIRADARPGHAFKTTSFGDVRVLVYCCVEHDKTRDELGGRQKGEKENLTAGLIGADGQGGGPWVMAGSECRPSAQRIPPTFSSGPLDPCPRKQYGPHRALSEQRYLSMAGLNFMSMALGPCRGPSWRCCRTCSLTHHSAHSRHGRSRFQIGSGQ